jgi:hypothetical protein
MGDFYMSHPREPLRLAVKFFDLIFQGLLSWFAAARFQQPPMLFGQGQFGLGQLCVFGFFAHRGSPLMV